MARDILVPRGGNRQVKNSSYYANKMIQEARQYAAPSSLSIGDLIHTGPVITPHRKTKIHHVKELRIGPNKSERVEAAEEIHPFVLSHRVGVTDLITNMDPMSEEFIRSLNLKSSSRPSTGWMETIPAYLFSSVTSTYISKPMRSLIYGTEDFQVNDLGSAGNPWTKDGWIIPQFQIGTGIVVPKNAGSEEDIYPIAEFLLNLWKHRPAQFNTLPEGAIVPVSADGLFLTLVNIFEAVEGLKCYSFVGRKGAEEVLYHVWLNKTYIKNCCRQLPMYFEAGGALSFILNAATGCFGISIDATGEASLSVETDGGPISTELRYKQVVSLHNYHILPQFTPLVQDLSVGWDSMPDLIPLVANMTNANWSNLGLSLTAGYQWAPDGKLKHLPWQVQVFMKRLIDYTHSKSPMATASFFDSTKKASEFFLKSGAERTREIGSLKANFFWKSLKAAATEFDTLIFRLRKQYIEGELVAEQKRLNPELSSNEVGGLLVTSSDKIGRFVFERSLQVSEDAVVRVAAE